MNEIKCPHCGSKARIMEGGGTSTLAMPFTYWDEDGVMHSSDPNIHTQPYRCTGCGNSYTVETYRGETTIK